MTTKRGHILNLDKGNAFGRLPDFTCIRTWNIAFRIMESIVFDDYFNGFFKIV